MKKAALVLLLPLIGCGSPSERPAASAEEPSLSCAYDNGAWCITTVQAASRLDTEKSVHWTLRDSQDNTGVIVEPPSCRGRPADGIYRRTSGTTLREGENWKIARIGFRADRTCDVLFMAPERAAASLQNVFLTRVNVCMAGTDCTSSDNVLAARIGREGIF